MHLAKLILLNWGQIEPSELAFGPVVQISGVTGSGKTTVLDAIQTVMTAAKDGLYSYNPGQDENSQRSKSRPPRTLGSYILGGDENEYARPDGAHGYIGAVFVPSPGEDLPPFTALIACAARLDTNRAGEVVKRTALVETLQLMILNGTELSLEDLVVSRSLKSLEAVSVEDIYPKLQKRYGEVQAFGDNKKHYLERLYGLFKGGKASSAEAEQAARTFSHFMAYKPMDNINDFVKNQVLEKYDLQDRVTNVSALMRNVSDLRIEARRYAENIQAIERIQRSAENLMTAASNEALENVLLGHFRIKEIKLRLEEHYKNKAELHLEQSNADKSVKEIGDGLDGLRTRQGMVLSSRNLNAVAIQLDNLRDRKRLALESFDKSVRGLLEAGDTIRRNLDTVRQLSSLPLHGFAQAGLPEAAEILQRAKRLAEEVDVERLGTILDRLVHGKEGDYAAALELLEFAAGMDARMTAINSLIVTDENSIQSLSAIGHSKFEHEAKAASEHLATLHEEQRNLAQGEVRYPPAVTEALRLLNESLPEANARVLCELIRPANEEWQFAIERLMGGTRFAILVNTQQEAAALRLLKSNSLANEASIAQLDRARKNSGNGLPHESIVNELLFDDENARAFMAAKYGQMIKVHDPDDLPRTARGLTKEGQSSGGYLMSGYREDRQFRLVFGQAARKKEALSLRSDIEEQGTKLSQMKAMANDFKLVRGLASSVRGVQVEAHAAEIHEACRIAKSMDTEIEQLDRSSIADLDAQLLVIENDIKTQTAEKEKALKASASAESKLRFAMAAIEVDLTAQEAAEHELVIQRAELSRLLPFLPEFDPKAAEEAAVLRLEEEGASETSIRAAKAGYHAAVDRLILNFSRHLQTYGEGKLRTSERIAYDIQLFDDLRAQEAPEVLRFVSDVMLQVNQQHRTQKGVGLAEKEGKLAIAEKDFNNAFTADFCQMLHDSLRNGRKTLDILNKEMETFRFGEETFRFDSRWVPGMKKYADFFEAVLSIDDLGENTDMFAPNCLPSELEPVRDEIVGCLLSSDTEAAQLKLAELADYRNYFRYEIYKIIPDRAPVALSTYGTASGGQFETPAYVIRLAAISSAFKLREHHHKGHLRMLVTDEAFGKVDETRARAILNYIEEKMDMQVVYIVTNTRSGPLLDMATHQGMFSKVGHAEGVGELKHIIIVQWQTMNRKEIRERWEYRRRRAIQDAVLAFEEANPA